MAQEHKGATVTCNEDKSLSYSVLKAMFLLHKNKNLGIYVDKKNSIFFLAG